MTILEIEELKRLQKRGGWKLRTSAPCRCGASVQITHICITALQMVKDSDKLQLSFASTKGLHMKCFRNLSHDTSEYTLYGRDATFQTERKVCQKGFLGA